MLAYQITVNNQTPVTAGVESGVMTVIANYTVPGENAPALTELVVSGLNPAIMPPEFSTWLKQELKVGDEIRNKLVEVDAAEIDPPEDVRTGFPGEDDDPPELA
jgi:hypothetical protein